MYMLRVPSLVTHCMHPTLRASVHPTAVSAVRRGLKHRSLSSDDPFGESAVAEDPSDGFYGAWSGVNFDAFANAAASDEVRAAHFGPEWSKFTTVGRMTVKMMGEQGRLIDAPLGEGGVAAAQRSLTSEELHLRDVQARKKLLEKNYATYEEFVERELGGSDEKDSGVGNADRGVDVASAASAASAEEDEDIILKGGTMSLPKFMANGGQQCGSSGATLSHLKSDSVSTRRRESVQAPEPLWHLILSSLGKPHGDPLLPRSDPFYWTTDEIIVWLTRMEAACQSPSLSAVDADVGLGTTVKETPLMRDLSMQEAFRMARTDGEFLLHHTVPNTLFQVMRRWHLRRQEIVTELMKEFKKNTGISDDNEHSYSTNGLDAVTLRNVVEAGRLRLDETSAMITRTLIQETICQCYPYCR